LLPHLNEGLAIVFANGTYNELYDKWFGPLLPPKQIDLTLMIEYLSLILVPVLLIMAFFMVWYLKREVKSQTKKLQMEISAHEKSAALLKESENNYRDLVEGTDDLITRIDAEGCFTFVNGISEKYLGLRPSECLGLLALNFIHPDDKPVTTRWFQQCVKQKVHRSTIENRQVNSKIGEVYTMLWTTSFEYDAQGNIINNKGLGRDITERKLAEIKIVAEKEKAQRYLNVAAIMFMALDFNGKITLINPKGLEWSSKCGQFFYAAILSANHCFLNSRGFTFPR